MILAEMQPLNDWQKMIIIFFFDAESFRPMYEADPIIYESSSECIESRVSI